MVALNANDIESLRIRNRGATTAGNIGIGIIAAAAFIVILFIIFYEPAVYEFSLE